MGREAKREGGPSEASAAPPRPGGEPRHSGQERWFAAFDPEATAHPQGVRRIWAAPLLTGALVLVAIARSVVLRALLPIVLATAALLLLARERRLRVTELARRFLKRGPARPSPARARQRGLCLSGVRLTLHGRGNATRPPFDAWGLRADEPRCAPKPPVLLLEIDKPFGIMLLASPRRDRLVALLSSSAGAFYLGAAYDAAARRAASGIIDRATIVGADEVGLEAVGPDGEPLVLAPDTLDALLSELARRAPGCQDRFFLTDARGAALTLDGRELRAGGRTFDLGAPLEWRAFVFQEAIGQAVALYQGTWVRQGASEIVLVCLLPSLTPAPEGEGVALSSLDRSALRDLRLMQGAPEDPPPADQRVAVDRLVMLPIRSALDKAPRRAAQPPRARA
jgi:hypothetical protein